MRLPGILLLSVLLGCPPAAAETAPEECLDGDAAAATVAGVVDGDTVILDDGTEVRLVGIQAPKLPLGREGFATWPMAPEAKAGLEDLVLGRAVLLASCGQRWDRHGRRLAHLIRAEDDLWVQAAMLRLGLARVYSFPDNRALVGRMLAHERRARDTGTGLWALDNYRPLSPEEARARIGRFELVEGRVLKAARVGPRTYLNFGADYREDFTVVIEREARAMFEDEGVPPQSLEGRRIRVRGWLRSFNGPMIEATHPEQIEVLE